MPAEISAASGQVTSKTSVVGRAFIALPMADQSPALAAVGQNSVHFAQQAGLHWVAPQNLHLTLLFLGRLRICDVPVVAEIIGSVAAQSVVFGIKFKQVGPFPHRRSPKLLAILPDRNPALLSLQAALARRLQAEGLHKPERAYRPHVTLARCKQLTTPMDSVQFNFDYTVTELHLFQSTQSRTSVQYQSLCHSSITA